VYVGRKSLSRPAGTRNLSIPTVIDRVIQRAVLQRLQPLWDPTFNEHSYGFAERLEAAVGGPFATNRTSLEGIVHHLSLALGGRPGQIFAQRLRCSMGTLRAERRNRGYTLYRA
jgi:hypothetical protein